MLLIDEADVFLGARTNESPSQNELVSSWSPCLSRTVGPELTRPIPPVFLTKLEYYHGMLFLTTNRFSAIDHAFQSRVDLFLPYKELTPAARGQVWRNFLERFGGSAKFDVTSQDLDRLSELRLNGREIRNVIKSALVLSSRQPNGAKVTAERMYMLAEKRVTALRLLAEQEAATRLA
ncbi:hypothetical protein VTK26DRAFT_4056 [Humicola hyalothermophila]